MQIDDIISCRELACGDRKPVSARVLGELLAPVEYHRPRPFYTDTKYLSHSSNNAYLDLYAQLVCPATPISLISFMNAITFGQGTVIVGNRSLLLDSAAEFIYHMLAPDGAEKSGNGFRTLHDDKRIHVTGTTLLVKRPWFRNFGHWLIDLMPLLPLVKDAGIDIDNVIFGAVHEGTLKTIMHTTAQLLYPDAKILYVEDDQQIRCECLLYVQPVHVPPLFKHPLAVEATALFAKTLFSSRSVESSAERIYLSRQRQYARTITNETELAVLLAANGFEAIYPEDYTFDDQIALFANAKVIVGAKGAAFSNMIFCSPGTHVLVLSPPSFTDPFFWDLAALGGVVYSEIFCPAQNEEMNDAHQSIDVPLESVRTFLNRL